MANSQTEALAVMAQVMLSEAKLGLKQALANVDARVLLASYAMYRLVGMPDESLAKQSRPAPAAIELAAWLLMPYFGTTDSCDSQAIQNGIDAIEEYQKAYMLAETFPPSETIQDEEHDSLKVHLRMHSGLVRGSAYPLQVDRRISMVFQLFEEELASLAGIGPCRSTAIAKAILGQVEDNIENTRHKIRAMVESGMERTKSEPDLRNRIASELQVALATMGSSWIPTFDEISKRIGGVKREEWDTFAELFGLSEISLRSVARIVDVQDHPIIFIDSERAFAAHGVAILDAIFHRFDAMARASTSLRDRYGRCVSSWMEEESASHLKRMFPAGSVVVNACYPDPDRPGGEAEADVVVLWGPFLIIAEAKGRKVDQEAFRGGIHRLKNLISKNIEDAFSQSQRLVRALELKGRLKLKEKATGRVVELNRDRLRRIMPISITMQHLFGIPTKLAAIQHLGLFKDNSYPWSVSIDDLDVVTRFSGSPDVFLHYIERRISHQRLEIDLNGDELDIFGQYLDNRLHPEMYEGRAEILNSDAPAAIGFHGGEEKFEPFYLAEWYGEPPPTHTVGLDVPEDVRAILNELRSRFDDGARWIAFALLGLSGPALSRLASAFKELTTRQAAGQRVLRITICEGSVVVNVLAHRGMSECEFIQNVTFRTRLEHYRAKAKTAVSIGINQNSNQVFEVAQWFEDDWMHDAKMDGLLEADRDRPRNFIPSPGFVLPGRNSQCPCGSGLKFKKCCTGKIRFRRGQH